MYVLVTIALQINLTHWHIGYVFVRARACCVYRRRRGAEIQEEPETHGEKKTEAKILFYRGEITRRS